jgi:hypothetical protein
MLLSIGRSALRVLAIPVPLTPITRSRTGAFATPRRLTEPHTPIASERSERQPCRTTWTPFLGRRPEIHGISHVSAPLLRVRVHFARTWRGVRWTRTQKNEGHVSVCREKRGRGFAIGFGAGLACFEPLQRRHNTWMSASVTCCRLVAASMWSATRSVVAPQWLHQGCCRRASTERRCHLAP